METQIKNRSISKEKKINTFSQLGNELEAEIKALKFRNKSNCIDDNLSSITKMSDCSDIIKNRIILGICAMEKKTSSEAMQNLLKLIKKDKKIELMIFSQNTILNKPIEKWRKVNALICFFSKGFPLHKAEKYAEKHNCYLINNIKNQRLLWDRTKIYKLLKKYDIPVAEHIFAKRYNHSIHDQSSIMNSPELEEQPVINEFDNYIQINKVKIQKPFVEKPFDAENHNIRIYYPMKEGGGSKHLFRKIKNISSLFKKNQNKIRRDDNYIYEEFLPNDGFDIKVSF